MTQSKPYPKYLIQANTDDGDSVIYALDTEKQREAKTLELIFGDDLAERTEEMESDLQELREEGELHFEGDPSIYWFRGYIEQQSSAPATWSRQVSKDISDAIYGMMAYRIPAEDIDPIIARHMPQAWLKEAEELITLRDERERQGVEIQRLGIENEDLKTQRAEALLSLADLAQRSQAKCVELNQQLAAVLERVGMAEAVVEAAKKLWMEGSK